MKFGFLSTLDSQLLPSFINSAISEGIQDISIIIDQKTSSEKDRLIFKERTQGKFGDYNVVNNLLFKLDRLSIPFYFVGNHNSKSAVDLYTKLNLDCLLNAGTPRKISDSVLKVVQGRVVNVHPGILPDYRGCSCVEWAIINDHPIGNTAHFMDLNYDTGPIICSEKYTFSTYSNYVDIRTKVYTNGCKLAAKVLKKMETKEILLETSIRQDPSEGKFWEAIPHHLEQKCIKKANEHKYKFQKS